MNRQTAVALIMYLQRAHAIVPTTGAEWGLIASALATVEGVANGVIEIEAKPVAPPNAGG
jgi:hypothetical protein